MQRRKGYISGCIGTIKMKAIMAIGVVALCCAGCASTWQSRSNVNLLPTLRPYVKEVANELGMVSEERGVALGEIAANIVARLEAGKAAKLTFICTHNSRRSHLSQIWLQTAAYYYGLEKVQA